jgi:hypothetical protein
MKNVMVLPPYGNWSGRYKAFWQPSAAAPSKFLGSTEADKLLKKNAFVDRMVDLISELYWPEWMTATNTWQGASRTTMIDMTECDLRLFGPLREIHPKEIKLGSAGLNRGFNEAYFTEDSRFRFGEIKYYFSHESYAPLLLSIDSQFKDGFESTVSMIPLQFKARFQRPRPYQGAMILGFPAFTCESTDRGNTPSLIAGHCMEGLFGGVVMDLTWRKSEPEIYDKEAKAILQQYATDYGDRRVLAGVHHPSDSLVTWLVCFELVKEVYQGNDLIHAQKFLKASISRSRIWAHVSALKPEKISCAAYNKLIKQVRALIT